MKITDTDPIEYNGKVLYENEFDRVKKMYGFGSNIPINSDIDPEERARRQLMRAKRKVNKSK